MVPRIGRHDGDRMERLLVVDDDPVVRDLIVDALATGGFNADACSDGLTALTMAAEKGYDLIVTDMRLPGMDGLSLINGLKTRGSTTDVIVVTGYGTIENAVQCMKAGAMDYIIKPFNVDQILLAVNKSLEIRELRERARERELYRELSYMDALTGVYNRRYFDEALKAELEKARLHNSTVVLFMVDVDDFKLYNDNNGHQMGDEALSAMGKLLKGACRGYDIVTRYGGEEFAIIFPGADTAYAAELANRIMKEVAGHEFKGAGNLPSGMLTVSIGVACYPTDATNADDLVRCSDAALYDAKRSGKNQVRLCHVG